MTKKVALSALVQDEALYPRVSIDQTHVQTLAQAIAAGATLPPIVAEDKTLRIVDGVHRRLAFLKVHGEEATAPVDLRKYKSDADLYLAAVALNSSHGRPLSRQDQTRIVLKLREFGVDDKTMSLNLHVPEPVIEKLAMRIVFDDAGASVPAKRGTEYLHGQHLSAGQLATLRSVRSAEVGRICIELEKLLGAKLVDLSDETTVHRLRSVMASIEVALASIPAVSGAA